METFTNLESVYKRLFKLSTLIDNWDQEKAPSPNSDAIICAGRIITFLEDKLHPSTQIRVNPMSDGGICIEIFTFNKYLVDIYNEGDIVFFYKDHWVESTLHEIRYTHELKFENWNEVIKFIK